ncbi:MAG: DUF3179 domain-containing (seleno)protein [Thermoplasmata archaeon]
MLESEGDYLTEFDASRARLREPDMFQRFRVPAMGEPLADAGVDPGEMLLIVERGEVRRAFLVSQLSYHHLAQGALGGQPYLVSFCAVCHSGVGMDPRIEGTAHHFSAGGLYNGLALLVDDETRTYWDHIRGLGLHGPLRGAQMKTFPLLVTDVRTALQEDPELSVSLSNLRGRARVFARMSRNTFRRKGFFPPGFRRTMGARDARLPEMTHGLGVMVGKIQRFYPMDRIAGGVVDEIAGRPVGIEVDQETQVPTASWQDDGTRPMQIFARWYGFATTFPRTEVFSPAG